MSSRFLNSARWVIRSRIGWITGAGLAFGLASLALGPISPTAATWAAALALISAFTALTLLGASIKLQNDQIGWLVSELGEARSLQMKLRNRIKRNRRDIRDSSEAWHKSAGELGTDLSALRGRVDSEAERLIESRFQIQDLRAWRNNEAKNLEGGASRVQMLEDLIRESVGQLLLRLEQLEPKHPAKPIPLAAQTTNIKDPLLSIAIPSYRRPNELRQCLESVCNQVAESGHNWVEVIIHDDASGDGQTIELAIEFGLQFQFVGVSQNEINLGLDANLRACADMCRGEYLFVLGNDDILLPGALDVLFSDLRDRDFDVVLYEKERWDKHLDRRLPDVPGSTPIEIDQGEVSQFDTVLQVAQRVGFLSAFGFVSTVIMRREPFMACDPVPYSGLTMYPQVGIIIEAFLRLPVLYRNHALVIHRTQTQGQKLAESIGRPEESFMAGRREKAGQWFGTSLAAFMQRAMDRTDLSASEVRELPESLFTPHLLSAWIEINRTIGDELGFVFDDSVTSDADRFSKAMTTST